MSKSVTRIETPKIYGNFRNKNDTGETYIYFKNFMMTEAFSCHNFVSQGKP